VDESIQGLKPIIKTLVIDDSLYFPTFLEFVDSLENMISSLNLRIQEFEIVLEESIGKFPIIKIYLLTTWKKLLL
jgi:hypothetical protein